MTKLASLTGSLIPRKGAARPAAARGSSVHGMAPATPRPAHRAAQTEAWDAAARDCAADAPIRVSLRLDRERHVRLKLVAVHLGRTLQSLLLEALDDFIANQDEADMHRARRRPSPD